MIFPFPALQVSALKNRLRKVSTTTGDGVAQAFLKAQASLFGSYRSALKIEPVSANFFLQPLPDLSSVLLLSNNYFFLKMKYKENC